VVTQKDNADYTTDERGAQGVPRFILVFGVVGVVAMAAAFVAILMTLDPPPSTQAAQAAGQADSIDGTGPGARETDYSALATVSPEQAEVLDGPTPAELAAQAQSSAAADRASDDGVASYAEPLPTLEALPASTLSLLAMPVGIESAAYEIAFSPYGWGPAGPEGRNLIIEVHGAQPVSEGAEELTDMEGANMAVWVEPGHIEILATGGTFAGTVEVRRQGDVGAIFLTEVTDE
jgi:hypothetical protein